MKTSVTQPVQSGTGAQVITDTSRPASTAQTGVLANTAAHLFQGESTKHKSIGSWFFEQGTVTDNSDKDCSGVPSQAERTALVQSTPKLLTDSGPVLSASANTGFLMDKPLTREMYQVLVDIHGKMEEAKNLCDEPSYNSLFSLYVAKVVHPLQDNQEDAAQSIVDFKVRLEIGCSAAERQNSVSRSIYDAEPLLDIVALMYPD